MDYINTTLSNQPFADLPSFHYQYDYGDSTDSTLESSPGQFGIIVANALTMIFICTGNVFTIVAVCVTPDLRTRCNMYTVSLAVADFFTGLIIPFYSSDLYPPFQEALDDHKYVCLIRYVFLFTFVSNSVLTMIAISVDRYIFIKYPLHYSTKCRVATVAAIIAGTWILSFAIGTVPLYYNLWNKNRQCQTFQLLPANYRQFTLCPLYLLCCLITAVIYGLLIREAIPQQRRDSQWQLFHHDKMSWWNRNKIKSIKMFMLVFGIFFVCWTPSFLIILIGYGTSVNPKLIKAFMVLGYLNSGMNFVIYAFKDRKFLNAFKSFVGMKRKSAKQSTKENFVFSIDGSSKDSFEGRFQNDDPREARWKF
ncbi:adenosine receptor A3-like [Gigantopelta aegis]|uniref:adenosine receptor A3-like n=1 Tax=Gigantopelta aegis TaxID=1735272 RepID=UPI001B88AC57|nr:adenosine receptor A3-like [Gigantopelta aegis]XP_041377131.1 adenosine receptor A3-like [Gigantopelta aegis]